MIKTSAKVVTVRPANAAAYYIHIGSDLYRYLPQLLRDQGVNSQIAVISVPPVSHLYLKPVLDSLGSGWQVSSRDVPDGEKSKSLNMAQELYSWLIGNRFERNSTIIALGGGVVGDLAGFVASTYLRGVNLVHLPTSLLAQVDSSIGGKVGVNHQLGKNLIGAFYQPKFIISDTSVLGTLEPAEYICGLGEVVKYAVLTGDPFFRLLEDKATAVLNRERAVQQDILEHCIRHKAYVVSEDTYETGLRSTLNLGHTFGHALETQFEYSTIKHGEAVLLGMLCAVTASDLVGMISPDARNRIIRLIEDLPLHMPSKLDEEIVTVLLNIMKRDKKVSSGKIHIIGIRDMGIVEKIVVSEEIVRKSFLSLNEYYT